MDLNYSVCHICSTIFVGWNTSRHDYFSRTRRRAAYQYIKKNKGEKSPKELQEIGPVTRPKKTLVNYYKKKKQARPNNQDPYK